MYNVTLIRLENISLRITTNNYVSPVHSIVVCLVYIKNVGHDPEHLCLA